MDFLAGLHEDGVGYSTINTARSALSTVVVIQGGTFGSHPLVTRFMKGIYERRPCFPRYKQIWDVNTVFNHLRILSPAHTLSLKQLTFKVLMLAAILSAQRGQSLHLLDIENMTLTKAKCRFKITKVVKQSKPGRHVKDIEFKAYPPDRRLCVVTYIRRYIEVTSDLRDGHTALFISYNKPHKPVSKDTLRRWLTQVMRDSGIDVEVFKPHSIRSAATSAAQDKAVTITHILETAGWSNAKTFAKYYNKPIITEGQFETNILDNV